MRLLSTLAILILPAFLNAQIYWGDSKHHKIMRCDLDGSNVQEIVSFVGTPSDIHVAVKSGKIYWSDSAAGYKRISRSNLDGSNMEVVVSNLSNPTEIEIDPDELYLYWLDKKVGDGKIERLNLSTLQRDVLAYPGSNIYYMNIDFNSGMLFYNSTNDASPETSSTINTGAAYPLSEINGYGTTGMGAYMVNAGFVALNNQGYAIEIDGYYLRRTTLGFSSINAIDISGAEFINAIFYDHISGDIYWANLKTQTTAKSSIFKSKVDGTLGVQTIYTVTDNFETQIDCLYVVPARPSNEPNITNVTASQRTDSELIDIYYDVQDADSTSVSVSVQISSDGGVSYTLPANTLSGDVGSIPTPSDTTINGHIIWDAGADWDNNYTRMGVIKVIAED